MIGRIVAVASLLLSSVTAQATLVSRTLEITATDFVIAFGAPVTPAISPVTINFSVTFDNAADVGPTTTGLTIHSFNLPYTAEYTYSAALDVLILATVAFPNGCSHPASSFCIIIDDFSLTSPIAFFVEQSPDADGGWHALTIHTSVIPEPATLLLLGPGLPGLVAARKRRQSSATPDDKRSQAQRAKRIAPCEV